MSTVGFLSRPEPSRAEARQAPNVRVALLGRPGQAEVEQRLEMLRACLYLYLAETPPVGLGVMTARSIAAGSVIVADEDGTLYGRALSLAEAQAHGWERAHDLFQIGPDLFLPPRGCFDDLFNHSCEPSGGWRLTELGAQFVAIRDLDAGEEITYDYSCHILSPDERMVCSCKKPSCRSVIGSFWTLPPLLQTRYRKLDVVSPAVAASTP